LARFRREVGVLQALQHRGIVPFIDAGVDQEGRPYVVMPRIRGKNIRDWSEGRSFAECVSAMGEVVAALSYAHANNVLHRDLKPSNILVRDSDEQPIVLDFGNAYILDEIDGPSLTSTVVGSMGYFPPEVAANPKLRSPTQDVFAAAVILYEIVARHRPDPLSYQPLHSRFGSPRELDSVLQRSLGAADQRPASASELREQLLEASS
jgi:serine/threonine protein kinase